MCARQIVVTGRPLPAAPEAVARRSAGGRFRRTAGTAKGCRRSSDPHRPGSHDRGDALGLLHDAALADARLAADDHQRGQPRRWTPRWPMGRKQRRRTSSMRILLFGPADEAGDRRTAAPRRAPARRPRSARRCPGTRDRARSTAAELGRRRGCLRRYASPHSAIGPGISGFTSARGRALSFRWARSAAASPPDALPGNGYRPLSSS